MSLNRAVSIANKVLSLTSRGFDQVAVFDDEFKQLFQNGRTLKATVKEEAKVMRQPLETGAMVTDHRIIMPIEIELALILSSDDYQGTYRQIRQLYLDATLLTVQTKTDVYPDQVISSMPHEESPDQYNVILLNLTLTQALFTVTTFAFAPRDPDKASTIERGVQQPEEADSAANSYLRNLVDNPPPFFRGA